MNKGQRRTIWWAAIVFIAASVVWGIQAPLVGGHQYGDTSAELRTLLIFAVVIPAATIALLRLFVRKKRE